MKDREAEITMATKDEKVMCVNGHVVGSFKEDVPDGTTVQGNQFGVDLDLADMVSSGQKRHVCRQCGERITYLRDDGYSIRTARGWVGGTP